MVFNFLNAISSETVLRFALNEPIDEIHAFSAPPEWRNLVELDLFCQYLFSDFLSISAYVRPLKSKKMYLPCHELISDDAQSKVVDRVRMIHFANYLWSHISWGSRSVFRVIWLNFPRNS